MAGKKGDGSRSRNELNGAQKYKVWTLLVEMRDDFERGCTSIKEAAEIVSKKLGFTVSESTIKIAIKQGIVSWKEGRAPAPKKRLETLEKRVDELETIVIRLLSDLEANSNRKVNSTDKTEKLPEAWVGK